MDRAFERIEGVDTAIGARDRECLVVIVTAHRADGHGRFLERAFESARAGGDAE